MRAIVIDGKDRGTLRLAERPDPEPADDQIGVRVVASAVNRADILQRRGRYSAPAGWPADIPGLEYAGIVDAIGRRVTRWAPGDRVMGLVGGGGYAERVVVHEREALPIPGRVGTDQAAALPESFLTAFDALVVRARVAPGERVLVHAAGSGLGTAAIQVARALGATVIGTSRSPAKLEPARALGLEHAIDSSGGAFASKVGEPVDVILDVIGAPAWEENLRALAPRGRLVLLGFLGGSRGELDLEPVLRKRIEVIGTVMRGRGLEERIALAERAERELLPLLADGALRPVIAGEYRMEEAAEAHRRMEEGDVFGKLILRW